MKIGFKKIACSVLAASLAFSGSLTYSFGVKWHIAAQAAEMAVYGEENSQYGYTVNSDGQTVTIRKWSGTDTQITIPEKIEEKTVTEIGANTFSDCSNLTDIKIPDSITKIGSGAFGMCSSLTKINIPSGVTTIEPATFNGCTSLADINIPESVTSIGGSAFYGCALTNVNISKNVAEIDGRAFSSCRKLPAITVSADNACYKDIDGVLFNKEGTTLVCVPAGWEGEYSVPDKVTAIGVAAFNGCFGVTKINLPDSVAEIGDSAFNRCINLTEINIPADVKTIEHQAFNRCESLKHIDIPDSVKIIGERAFSYCSLTDVVIPENVEQIGSYAFYNCQRLANIKVPKGVTSIGRYCFGYYGQNMAQQNINKNSGFIIEGYKGTAAETYANENEFKFIEALVYGDESSRYSCIVNDDGESVTIKKWSGTDTQINIPEKIEGKKVTGIGDAAFDGCITLISVAIPESVTAIGKGAFQNCSALTTVTIPESVTTIGGWAFAGCSALTKITLPKGITGIEQSVFVDCSSLTEITIPNGVTSIGSTAFAVCSSLTEINLPESLTSIGARAFMDCSSLLRINIPEGIMSLDACGIFGLCPCLTDIKVSEKNQNYKDIDGVLFNKAGTELVMCPTGKEIEKYDIPAGTVNIGNEAFRYCRNLTEINIPEGVTNIGNRAFYGCRSITDIKIPDSVKSIGSNAFCECDAMTSATIPSGVTDIGEKSFGYDYVFSSKEYLKYDNFTIKGYKDTAAETYAAENGFKFIDLKNASTEVPGEDKPGESDAAATKESDLNIVIEYNKDLIEDDDNVTLVTIAVSKDNEDFGKIKLDDIIADGSIKPEDVKLAAYDIVLKKQNGQTVQPKGAITVKIPVPKGFTGNKCKVYYLAADGSFTDMKAVFKDKFIEFTTSHFSTYVITETELKTGVLPAVTETPGDGENNNDNGNNDNEAAGADSGNSDVSGIPTPDNTAVKDTENTPQTPDASANGAVSADKTNNAADGSADYAGVATGDIFAPNVALYSLISIISAALATLLGRKKRN